jgi:RNA polymerase sigma factor (sigma-70 family)
MIAEYSDGSASVTKEAIQENERLVRAIANGDREAERTFAERYLRPVRALLLARSRLPDLAADLQQDVMIEAICALRSGQLRDAQKLSAFVSAIARNRLNNHYRSSRRTEALELPDDLPDLSNASNDVEEQQREAQAMQAISSLEPVDKNILQMTLVDGLKPGVIAKRLQLSPDVVRQRKLRATRRVIEFVRRQSQKEIQGHSNVGKVK